MFRGLLEALRRWWQRAWCRLIANLRPRFGMPPHVRCWLLLHPNVANAIKWQFEFQSTAYDVPETAKRPYFSWTGAEQAELQGAFDAAWAWLESPGTPADPSGEGLPYPPKNLNDTTNDNDTPWTRVAESWARSLYVRWVAFCLAVEIGNRVPWSITGYGPEQLQVLFDSAAMMTRPAGTGAGFTVVTGSPGHANYIERDDNLGTSMPAPPWYTWSFLVNEGLIGKSRLLTIGTLLQWVSDHCVHYFGAFTYGEADNHWQYRGNPPITRIVEGTTNPNVSGGMFGHWTAGCHGTTGFLRNVLRAANIPVAISTVCGHSHAVFLTEGVYLDHGDNPYNQTFKATGLPASDLLIDHPTYVAWFGASTDNRSEGCDKIGHQVTVLAGQG